MKKTLFIAAAVFELAACTNQTDVLLDLPSQEVAVKAVTQKASRGAVTGTALPFTTDIYLFSTRKNSDTYEKWLDCAQFTNKDKNSSNYWTGGYTYDPKFDSFEFIGFTCDEGADFVKPTADIDIDKTYKRIKSLTLDFTNSPLSGSTDLLVSDLAKIEKKDSAVPAISLNFRHALAWIQVNFTVSASASASSIKINDVCLGNVPFKGKLTVTPDYSADGSVNKYNEIWSETVPTPSTPFPAYQTDNPDGLTLTDAAQQTAKGILIIPCKQTDITFKYKTPNGSGATEWQTFDLPLDTSKSWEAGKKYIYNISVSTTDVSVLATVVGWETVTPPTAIIQ